MNFIFCKLNKPQNMNLIFASLKTVPDFFIFRGVSIKNPRKFIGIPRDFSCIDRFKTAGRLAGWREKLPAKFQKLPTRFQKLLAKMAGWTSNIRHFFKVAFPGGKTCKKSKSI